MMELLILLSMMKIGNYATSTTEHHLARWKIQNRTSADWAVVNKINDKISK